MKTTATLAGILLMSSVALVRGAAPVSAESAEAVNVAPFKAIALTVGSKRAIGYFANDEKACNLTLMLADAYADNGQLSASQPVRVNVVIGAGTSARVETYQSNALSFSCAADAGSLSVHPVERVAYNAVK